MQAKQNPANTGWLGVITVSQLIDQFPE